jgi:multidrug efflux pump
LIAWRQPKAREEDDDVLLAPVQETPAR